MMFSNNPLFLRDQDHLAKHADMIEAARAEPHSDSKEAQPGGLTGPSVATFLHIYDREFGGAAALAAAKAEIERLKADIERMGHEDRKIGAQLRIRLPQEDRKIGAQLRIRLPQDYVVSDGPGLHINDAEQMRAANISLRQITEYEPGKL